ncbi:MAG: hypothetical protein WAO19_06965 [Candidatus Kryptoniota bacterium]
MANQPQISATNRKYVSPSFTDTDPYYSTIQNAINSLGSGYPSTPWGIYIYPGVYNESLTLKSNVSLIGSGIGSTIVKGTGSSAAIQGTTDSGGGNCYIVGLSIDGNGQSCVQLPASSTSEQVFFFDVYLYTSVTSGGAAVTVGNNQTLFVFNMHCVNLSTKFNEGIATSGNAQLRIHNSQIAYTNSYCIDHQSSQYSEAYNSFLVGGACCYCSSGVVNFYVCQTVGSINAYSSSKIKHVDSFHANQIIANDSSTIWISGMQWAEEAGNDIQIVLNGSSKVVLANSRAKVITNALNVVTVNSQTATFKAINSVIVNTGSGATITGVSGATIYLYYCVMDKDINTVSKSSDSVYIVTTNSE